MFRSRKVFVFKKIEDKTRKDVYISSEKYLKKVYEIVQTNQIFQDSESAITIFESAFEKYLIFVMCDIRYTLPVMCKICHTL